MNEAMVTNIGKRCNNGVMVVNKIERSMFSNTNEFKNEMRALKSLGGWLGLSSSC